MIIACALLATAVSSAPPTHAAGEVVALDGTGSVSFTFWAARLDAPDRHDRLTGFDETTGPSGACGVNRWLNVRMPFTLTRTS